MVKPDASPTSRALMALELVQGSPGLTAGRLARRLGVSERAARRYVGILREAGIPIDSARGPYGGYRVGRSTLSRRMILRRLAWSASPNSSAVRVTCHSFRSNAVITIRRSASSRSAW